MRTAQPGETVDPRIDRRALLGVCLEELLRKSNSQKFKLGGGRIQAFVARKDVPAPLFGHDDDADHAGESVLSMFNHEHIKAFVGGSDEDRAHFEELHRGAKGVNHLREAYRFFTATGDQQCVFGAAHDIVCVKNDRHPAFALDGGRPRRAPAKLYKVLGLFSDFTAAKAPEVE